MFRSNILFYLRDIKMAEAHHFSRTDLLKFLIVTASNYFLEIGDLPCRYSNEYVQTNLDSRDRF